MKHMQKGLVIGLMLLVMIGTLAGCRKPEEEDKTQFTEPTLAVDNVTASFGEQVEVSVTLGCNPGIVGMTLRLIYDESALTLTKVNRGTALSEMTYFMEPLHLESGCQFPWAAEEVRPEDATNGEILILTFTVSDSAAPGKYAINMAYDNGAIIDNDLMPVDVKICNGGITVN